jgi:hypothetical protein
VAADFEVRGAADLKKISTVLRATAAVDLKKELVKGLREGTKPLTEKNREAALRLLPKRGGLAKRVAKTPQRTRVRTGGTPGVSLVAGKAGSGARGADRGVIRHRVFGGDEFVEQKVPAGWFTHTNEANKALVLPSLERVMNDVAKKIERRLR